MNPVKILEAQIVEGKCKVEDDTSILGKLAQALVEFETGFEIMPETGGEQATPAPVRIPSPAATDW